MMVLPSLAPPLIKQELLPRNEVPAIQERPRNAAVE
jgi:hypothetical protein